jgi:hypothetical protein
VRIISPGENRRDLGHVPQLFRPARVAQALLPMPNYVDRRWGPGLCRFLRNLAQSAPGRMAHAFARFWRSVGQQLSPTLAVPGIGTPPGPVMPSGSFQGTGFSRAVRILPGSVILTEHERP